MPVNKRGVVNFSHLQKAVTLLRAVGTDCYYQRSRFISRVFRVGFVMNEVAVAQVFLSTLGLHLPIFIPSLIDYFFIWY